MSHSDSEIKCPVRKNLKQLHIELKARTKNRALKKTSLINGFKLCRPEQLKLLQAVNYNNTDEVQKLLEEGVSPNSTDNEMRSALHIAVSKGYADIVKLLLEHGANPNKRDIIHNTPLHLAACVHNFPIISMLIQANADVSCLDLHGRNPYQLAWSKLQILKKIWREGEIEMVKLREELEQVVDLLLSLFRRGINRESNLIEPSQSNVIKLNAMKQYLNSGPADQLDDQMTQLMNDIEQFKIT